MPTISTHIKSDLIEFCKSKRNCHFGEIFFVFSAILEF